MDIRSFIIIAELIAISLSSALFTPNSFADINADTTSEDRFWINRSHKNLAKVNNFESVVEQSFSNQTTPIISNVIVKTPTDFYQKTDQPETKKGFEASYHNNTITLHDPINKQALKIKGLNAYKESSSLDRVKGTYMYSKDNYEQEFTPSIHVSNRLSVGIDFMAKSDDLEIQKVEAFVDYHYSLIMQSNYILKNGLTSKIKNTKMTFNHENSSIPNISLSKDTELESWNLKNGALSKKKVSKKIDKDIQWPEDEDDLWGFAKQKFYHQKNKSKKIAAAYYYSDNYFLITLTNKSNEQDINAINIPTALEVPLSSSTISTKLNQFPSFSSLQFESKGIDYTLISNIHPQSLLTIAKTVISPKE